VSRMDSSLERHAVRHSLYAFLQVLHEVLAIWLVSRGRFFNLVDQVLELVLGLKIQVSTSRRRMTTSLKRVCTNLDEVELLGENNRLADGGSS
jgi:hypothetical protein